VARRGSSGHTPKKHLSMNIDARLAFKVQIMADRRNTDVSAIIEESLREYLQARAWFLSDSPSS